MSPPRMQPIASLSPNLLTATGCYKTLHSVCDGVEISSLHEAFRSRHFGKHGAAIWEALPEPPLFPIASILTSTSPSLLAIDEFFPRPYPSTPPHTMGFLLAPFLTPVSPCFSPHFRLPSICGFYEDIICGRGYRGLLGRLSRLGGNRIGGGLPRSSGRGTIGLAPIVVWLSVVARAGLGGVSVAVGGVGEGGRASGRVKAVARCFAQHGSALR